MNKVKKVNKPMNKAYDIKMIGANDAELDLYGEVVSDRPMDWYTGEPTEEAYIVASELLADLDTLKTKDNITLHINSVGGDLYAGLAIYNRLKSLPANITTINDGLAASAASLIFQAGDTRKVNAGSNLMVHQAMGFLFGYYQLNDLNQVSKQLRAANKTAVNVYAEASGRDADEIKRMVDAETWLTGQEAVEAGLADEVIGDEDISMSLTNDGKHIIVNGVQLSTKGMHNIPAGLPIMPANSIRSNVAPATDDKQSNERDDQMDIKNLNDLKEAYPDLMEQARAEAFDAGRTQGAADERARIQSIESIQSAVADKTMLDDAKFGEHPLTAEQLALKAMQSQAAIGHAMLDNLADDTKKSGVDDVKATPVQPEMSEAEKRAAQNKADADAALDFLFGKKEGE
ncbi:MAG: Clp protease ClpP [Peptococcaceae bacterium]|nr:Clp protease ClpP [Peptococcaceae bacterium]